MNVRMMITTAVILTLPIILPVIFVLALLVKRDGGPAFYSHDRIGRRGLGATTFGNHLVQQT